MMGATDFLIFTMVFSCFRSRRWRARLAVATLLLSSLVAQAAPSYAEPGVIDTARFTLRFHREDGLKTASAQQIASDSLEMLDQTYHELSQLFDFAPSDKVLIRFFSPKEFHRHTGAPEWTSAMYLRGEISIPLPERKPINREQIGRAVKHEYVHAVTAELSGRSCPAWLDEGVAQIIEGDPNPLLGPALRRWLKSNEPMPLSWLKNGFTSMSNELVPAAYAQSLFATRLLVDAHGFKAVKRYLVSLKQGNSDRTAFKSAFGQEQATFEAELKVALAEWASSDRFDP